MASKSIALFLVLVMATCSLQALIIVVEAAADCRFSNLGCFPAETAVSLMSSQNRKMVAGLKEHKDLLVGVEEGSIWSRSTSPQWECPQEASR